MWKPASLPFSRDDGLCPTDLPAAQEIRASEAIIKVRGTQTVVAVGPNIVVKYGRSTQALEGQTLLYLERHVPTVPAPRLYAMYYDDDELFLVMQRVPGVQLDTIWDDLSEEEKSSLTANLRIVFDSLRNVECPWPDFFGAVDGGPVPHDLFFDHEKRPNFTGPFVGEAAFNAGMTAKFELIQEVNNRQETKNSFYKTHLDKVLYGHKPTLSHSDMQRKNIIVNEAMQNGDQKARTFDVAVVDWEDAGWYPDYWDYVIMFVDFRWEEDWCRRIEEILTVWPAEAAMLKMINTDIFF